jgi:hypothetical protein
MIEDVWRNPFPQATPEQAKKSVVIPAKAGIHVDLVPLIKKAKWIPAFAGMTTYPVLL